MSSFSSLHIISEDKVLHFAHFFDGTDLPAQDEFEAQLSARVHDNPPRRDREWCTVCAGKPVAGRVVQGLTVLLGGSADTNELALAEALPFFIALVTATCDGKLTPAQLVSFQGKVSICLHEACPEGALRYTDVATILRSSKLKAPL
jgi:hypothetical protein